MLSFTYDDTCEFVTISDENEMAINLGISSSSGRAKRIGCCKTTSKICQNVFVYKQVHSHGIKVFFFLEINI